MANQASVDFEVPQVAESDEVRDARARVWGSSDPLRTAPDESSLRSALRIWALGGAGAGAMHAAFHANPAAGLDDGQDRILDALTAALAGVNAAPAWEDLPGEPDAETAGQLQSVGDRIAGEAQVEPDDRGALHLVLRGLWQVRRSDAADASADADDAPAPHGWRALARHHAWDSYRGAVGAILHTPREEILQARLVCTRLSDIGEVCGLWAKLTLGPCAPPGGRFATRGALEDVYDHAPPAPAGAVLLAPSGPNRKYHDDGVFAALRVAGPNPIAIRRVFSKDDLPQELHAHADDESLNEGRLYMTNFSDQVNLVGRAFEGGPRKYLQATVGLFRSADELHPVAIWLAQSQQRVVTPTDPDPQKWKAARCWLQVSDFLHHEMYTHLGRAHSVILSLTRTLYKELEASHPVRRLLDPSLLGVVANMEVGKRTLIPVGGMVDELMPPRVQDSVNYGQNGVASFKFLLLNPRHEVASRGCDEKAVLPYYPYRDDAFKIWDAMHTYVRKVLTAIYPTGKLDNQVQRLYEALRETWTEEHRDGLHESLPGLVDLVTGIMFHSGPFHAAVNYPQADLSIVAPAFPAASYAAPGQEGIDCVNMLPHKAAVARQVEVMTILSGRAFDKITEVPPLKGHEHAHETYMLRLQEIDAEIRAENRGQNHPLPYDYLLPTMVPSAANV